MSGQNPPQRFGGRNRWNHGWNQWANRLPAREPFLLTDEDWGVVGLADVGPGDSTVVVHQWSQQFPAVLPVPHW